MFAPMKFQKDEITVIEFPFTSKLRNFKISKTKENYILISYM